MQYPSELIHKSKLFAMLGVRMNVQALNGSFTKNNSLGTNRFIWTSSILDVVIIIIIRRHSEVIIVSAEFMICIILI